MNQSLMEKLEASTYSCDKELYTFFSDNYTYFTPYKTYFYLRYNEFKLIGSLFPGLLENKKILEIGCGFGFNSFLLSFKAQQVQGVDIPDRYPSLVMGEERTSVEVAKELNELLKRPNVKFEECWPSKIECCENESQDIVFSEYVLEHIPNLEDALHEMHRVLKPGGEMLHVVPITQDAAIQFMYAQINNDKKKKTIKNLLNNIKHPVVIPQCHSEFLTNYDDQIRLYSLENYVFLMQECGFEIRDIKQSREHNRIVWAKKR